MSKLGLQHKYLLTWARERLINHTANWRWNTKGGRKQGF